MPFEVSRCTIYVLIWLWGKKVARQDFDKNRRRIIAGGTSLLVCGSASKASATVQSLGELINELESDRSVPVQVYIDRQRIASRLRTALRGEPS